MVFKNKGDAPSNDGGQDDDQQVVRKERSPGFKLAITVLIGALLMIPLLTVYALVYDRQSQSETARAAVAEGWGDEQYIAGPVIVIPYDKETVETFSENDVQKSRTVTVRSALYLSSDSNAISADIKHELRTKSIYDSVVYVADVKGKAIFSLPDDLARYGVDPADLKLGEAEIRFPIADPRGLLAGNSLKVNGETLALKPGKGLALTDNAGFFAFLDWSSGDALMLDYKLEMRGNGRLTLVPRGGRTQFDIASSWPHPNFAGDFLPNSRDIKEDGFSASYVIDNLALGQSIVQLQDNQPERQTEYSLFGGSQGTAKLVNSPIISLIEPVNLYSQVERSVKYGFLFIGFTFLTFLLFDIIAGARVAAAEYLLTGAALILFFVLLLALAEVIGFLAAYLLAAGAMIGLVSAYSGAVLGSRRRALFIGAMLTGLYAVLFVLLNLEAYSLLAGALLLFIALATVMYVTRKVDWSGIGRKQKA